MLTTSNITVPGVLVCTSDFVAIGVVGGSVIFGATVVIGVFVGADVSFVVMIGVAGAPVVVAGSSLFVGAAAVLLPSIGQCSPQCPY